MHERPLWPLGSVAVLAGAVVVAGIGMWAVWGWAMGLWAAAVAIVLLVVATRWDISADGVPMRRLHTATATVVMGAGLGMVAASLTSTWYMAPFGLPGGALMAITGYIVLRRRLRAEETV